MATQNFGWVGHNAFGPTNNWPVCWLILLKISKNLCHQMSDFKAKMHQIRSLTALFISVKGFIVAYGLCVADTLL